MAPIITSTEIDRAATEVYDYATDPTRFNQWQNGVVDGHMDHTGTPQVGARCMTSRRIGSFSLVLGPMARVSTRTRDWFNCRGWCLT